MKNKNNFKLTERMTKIIGLTGTVLASTLLGYFSQTLADSGESIFEKIIVKILIANCSYISFNFLFLIGLKRKNYFAYFAFALTGSILNIFLVSLYESFCDSCRQGFLDVFIIRLVILTPIETFFIFTFVCIYIFASEYLCLILMKFYSND